MTNASISSNINNISNTVSVSSSGSGSGSGSVSDNTIPSSSFYPVFSGINLTEDSSSDDSIFIGLTLIELIIVGSISLIMLIFCFYLCCIFGKKKPPLEYEDIVNDFGSNAPKS